MALADAEAVAGIPDIAADSAGATGTSDLGAPLCARAVVFDGASELFDEIGAWDAGAARVSGAGAGICDVALAGAERAAGVRGVRLDGMAATGASGPGAEAVSCVSGAGSGKSGVSAAVTFVASGALAAPDRVVGDCGAASDRVGALAGAIGASSAGPSAVS
jgi:hypothetical protein